MAPEFHEGRARRRDKRAGRRGKQHGDEGAHICFGTARPCSALARRRPRCAGRIGSLAHLERLGKTLQRNYNALGAQQRCSGVNLLQLRLCSASVYTPLALFVKRDMQLFEHRSVR